MIPELTKKELAEIAGYTYRRLYTIDRDLPEDKKLFVDGKDGKYSLAHFVQRWVQYNVETEESASNDLDLEKAMHEAVKRRKTEIQVEMLEGQLVEVAAVSKLWADIAATVASRFMNLARKVAPSLVMMGSVENIEAIIDREVRDALEMIADTPLPGEQMEMDEERDDNE